MTTSSPAIQFYPSLFDRTISRRRSSWTLVWIALIFVGFAVVTFTLDGESESLTTPGFWRTALTSPAIIIYVLAVAPSLQRMGPEVIRAFRPVVQLDDESFARLVWESSYVSPRGEILSLAIGALAGAILTNTGSTWSAGLSWTRLYWIVTDAVLLGLLAWVVYVSIVGTRQTVALHQQPLNIDLFDLSPFIPIGRQSLILALVFIGGILISLLLGVQPESLRVPQFWVTYTVMALIPVLIFFLNMRPTHHVLSEEKKKRQGSLERRFRTVFHQLEQQENQPDSRLAEEINVLSIYEQHLNAARTWPYNTSQLRTLAITVLVPLLTLLVRLLLNRIFQVSL